MVHFQHSNIECLPILVNISTCQMFSGVCRLQSVYSILAKSKIFLNIQIHQNWTELFEFTSSRKGTLWFQTLCKPCLPIHQICLVLSHVDKQDLFWNLKTPNCVDLDLSWDQVETYQRSSPHTCRGMNQGCHWAPHMTQTWIYVLWYTFAILINVLITDKGVRYCCQNWQFNNKNL